MTLQKSEARCLTLHVDMAGKYLFTIEQGGNELYRSKTYDTMGDCTKDGVIMLDIYHEHDPLRCDDAPAGSVGLPRHDWRREE